MNKSPTAHFFDRRQQRNVTLMHAYLAVDSPDYISTKRNKRNNLCYVHRKVINHEWIEVVCVLQGSTQVLITVWKNPEKYYD